jgi:prepilin-type N-terminal cleavage/methylation domain-containing protein
MKIRLNPLPRRRLATRGQAFTLVEVMVAVAIIGISVGALLTGVSSSVFKMRMARENLRATQIMLERVETLRLYNWEQLTKQSFFGGSPPALPYAHALYDSAGRQYICTHFEEKYDPNSANAQGLRYSGKMRMYDPRESKDPNGKPININTSYSTNDMKAVWVEVTWQTGKIARKRTLTTLVSRNGLQNYVYGW